MFTTNLVNLIKVLSGNFDWKWRRLTDLKSFIPLIFKIGNRQFGTAFSIFADLNHFYKTISIESTDSIKKWIRSKSWLLNTAHSV